MLRIAVCDDSPQFLQTAAALVKKWSEEQNIPIELQRFGNGDEFLKANELKVVIFHPSDIEWAEMHAAKVNKNCILFLQPEWSRREKVSTLIIDYIKENPKWRLSLQVHKFLNIP